MPIAAANGINLWYEEFGQADHPVLLMISGLGAHATGFAPAFCQMFADRSLRVIRFDNRDMGFSTHDADWSYTLSDMAADAVGLLDALEVDRAHVWGASMGGMIAQSMAIEHPERVHSLTSVMSTTGDLSVGGPEPAILDRLIADAAAPPSPVEALARGMATARLIGSQGALWDEVEHTRRQSEQADRNFDPYGTGRQLAAIFASGSREKSLAELNVPATVMHGTADPLVNISGGRRTANLIPGARWHELEGMGHDLPSTLWPEIVDLTLAAFPTICFNQVFDQSE